MSLEIKIIKKETDPICTRVSLGGNQTLGYYIVYRGELNDVLTVIETCAAAVRAELVKPKLMICKRCGSQANSQVLTPTEQHYGKVICASCGNWLAWLPRPKRPIDQAKLPKPEPGAPLPQLTGKSAAQIAFGERCREQMLAKLEDDLTPQMFAAMRTIADCTFWIANMNKAVNLIRWPEEWS